MSSAPSAYLLVDDLSAVNLYAKTTQDLPDRETKKRMQPLQKQYGG